MDDKNPVVSPNDISCALKITEAILGKHIEIFKAHIDGQRKTDWGPFFVFYSYFLNLCWDGKFRKEEFLPAEYTNLKNKDDGHFVTRH